MGKTDEKGEPVQTITIGGKKIDVPVIFVLPEETGEKEIERYQHPKVHIESKKIAPLLAGAGAATGIGAAGKKIGDTASDAASSGVGLAADTAKLSETLSAESEEESLEELTDGKLEEIEKLPTKKKKYDTSIPYPVDYRDEKDKPKKKKKKEPLLSNSWEALRQEWGDVLGVDKAGSSFPVPKEKDSLDQPEDAVSAKDSENEAILRHALGKPQGVRDTIVAREGEPTREKKIPFESGRAMKAWVSWLQKKKEWDEKEREKDKIMQEQRVARQTHVDEEISGIGSKQHKEEARAIREGKVAPSRTATIATERPWDLEKPSSDKKVIAARLLHEFKGFGKAQALKRIKELQDKRRKKELEKAKNKPSFDPSKVADEKFFNSEKEALGAKGATGVLRHRNGMFTPVFGDSKELDRVGLQLEEHNRKKPSPLDSFDPEQNISDISGETQERTKSWEKWMVRL